MTKSPLRFVIFATTLLCALALHLETTETDSTLTFRVEAASPVSADRSLEHCIRRGAGSWEGDHYNVQLTNRCDEPVRVHWCVRRASGGDHCHVHPYVAPRATVGATARNAGRPIEMRFEACARGERCRVRN